MKLVVLLVTTLVTLAPRVALVLFPSPLSRRELGEEHPCEGHSSRCRVVAARRIRRRRRPVPRPSPRPTPSPTSFLHHFAGRVPNLSADTLLDFCDNVRQARNVLYRVQSKVRGNSIDVLAVRERPRRCLAPSNEWLSLLRNMYYNTWGPGQQRRARYEPVASMYARLALMNRADAIFINASVVPLITSFSTGTVHGFTGFWLILMEWCRAPRENARLLIYERSDAGMLEIVRHACNSGLVDRNRLTYIAPDVTYLFPSLEVIPSPEHNMWGSAHQLEISNFVHRHFVDSSQSSPSGSVAVLKTHRGITGQGVLKKASVDAILQHHRAALIDPAIIGEFALINILARATVFVTSWGTVMMKNMIYLGDSCTDIYVYHTADFASQTLGRHHPTRFRNANIRYIAVEEFALENERGSTYNPA